jgi:hypothetical protein|tara:strand:- start:406 stop:1428 length:1023 start_codon:yes stop_codon:yes gene_type:complete
MGYKIKLNENQLKKLISEETVERPCSKFDSGSDNYKFCILVNSPTWVKMTRPLVDKVLEHKKRKWRDVTSSEKQKSVESVLDIIEDSRPQAKQTIQKVREKLDSLGFIYDEDDQWDYINKLNTNYSDTATFMTDLVDKFSDYPIKELYDDIKEGNKTNLQDLINQGLDAPQSVYDNLIDDPTDKFKYTRMAKYYTGKGDSVEDIIQTLMESNGWVTIHRGGNGDPIDTLLGIDLIVEKNGFYKFIQSKKVFEIRVVKGPLNPTGAYLVKGNVFGIREDMIDLLGYATEDGRAIVTPKQRKTKKNSEGKFEYTNSLEYPTPTRNTPVIIQEPFQNITNLSL